MNKWRYEKVCKKKLINEDMIVFVGMGEWINKWKYDSIHGNEWMN